MKSIKIFSIVLLTSLNAYSQETIVTPEKQQKIKEYISHFETNGQLMGNLSIYENGNEVLNSTFGEQNIHAAESEIRGYTVGSITKMFTALLFAKLYEDGEIGLDEKLSNYYSQIPNSDKIELKHMLSHTSGLGDYLVKNDSLMYWLKNPQTDEDIINEIIRQDVSFQPGDSLEYSNSAYYLLARILEKKHGKPFKNIIADEIATPLGLQNTLGIDQFSVHKNIAKSYKKKNGTWSEMEELYFPNVSGAGDIVSNAFDLNKFLNAIFSNQIISQSTLNEMLPAKGDWFGMGIMKVPFYEVISFGHGGNTYGTSSVMSYNPSNNLAISYIINGENHPTNDFAIGLLSIVYDKEFTLPDFHEYAADKKFYEFYEATYGAEGFPITIKIYQEEGELRGEGEGQPSFALTPTEKHVFKFQSAGIKLTFDIEKGNMMLEQAGQKFELKKL